MKKSILTALCLITTFVICKAQNSVYPKLPYTNLSSITASGNNIFASGSCGHAQISTDAGISWDIFSIPDDKYMFDIEIIPNTNDDQCYLINSDELYSLHVDHTLTELNTQVIDIYGRFLGLEIDDDHIYVISEGAINRAPHGTLEWELVSEVVYDTPYVISATSSNANNIFIGNRDGQIFQTSKNTGGYVEITNIGGFIQKLDMADDEVGYLTMSGASGPLKTTDGGTTWNSVLNWPENNPVYVYNRDIFLTSNTNRYFVSLDGGQTVTAYYINDDAEAGLIDNVKFLDDGTIYMAGGSSTILRSHDLGETYENLLPLNRSDLYNIDIRSSSGIASGYESIITTEDGGNNWIPYTNSEITQVNDAIVISQGKYAIASESGVSIVTNGNIESTAGASAYRLFSSVDNSYMLAGMRIGSSHVISKSEDGGISWSNKIFNEDYIGRIKVNNQGILYAPSATNKYLRSDDDGETWNEVILPVDGWFKDMILEEEIALFSIGNELYESTDGENNFNSIATGYLIDNIHILAQDHYTYTTGSNSTTTIYERKPGDNNFTSIKQWCGASYGSYNNNGEIWYTKRGGHINKQLFDITTSTVNIENSELVIFPNPVALGQRLVIKGLEDETEITIIDNIGRVVLTQKNIIGNIEIETASLSKGNYYITLKDTNKKLNSRLMIF